MKKNLFLNGIILFLTIWILYAGTTILVRVTLGRDIDLLEIIITSFICPFIFLFFQIVLVYFNRHRERYLEINNSEKPSFKIGCSSAIDVPLNLDFTCLKNEITKKWVVTFSDDINHVLKFRVKINFFKNIFETGPAAWLKFDADNRKIQMECFSLVGTDTYEARRMQKEIEKCFEV